MVGRRERRGLLLPKYRVTSHEPDHLDRRAQRGRLGDVVSAQPGRIVADRIAHDLSPRAIAAGDLRGEAGQRHEGIDEIRMPLAPQPGLHSAHRGSHHEARVIDAEPLREQPVLGLDHIEVAIAGESRPQPIAGLTRVPVADPVGQHDEVPRRIQQLARTEQLSGELRANEIAAVAGRPVQDQDGVSDPALGIGHRLAERAVVNPQLREGLSRGEPELPDDVVAFHGRRVHGSVGP